MQVNYQDGSEELVRLESMKQIEETLANEKVAKVTIHKPGSIITLQSGTQYRVADDGSWRRI